MRKRLRIPVRALVLRSPVTWLHRSCNNASCQGAPPVAVTITKWIFRPLPHQSAFTFHVHHPVTMRELPR